MLTSKGSVRNKSQLDAQHKTNKNITTQNLQAKKEYKIRELTRQIEDEHQAEIGARVLSSGMYARYY